MANKDQYKAKSFVAAIKGSGGIITTIANRVGCDWNTAKKYITEYPTVQRAFQAECETTDDIAESVLVNNLKLALNRQQKGDSVDASDAKWWIERRRRDKFSTKQEQAKTITMQGDRDNPVRVEQAFNPANIDLEKFSDEEVALLYKIFVSQAPGKQDSQTDG